MRRARIILAAFLLGPMLPSSPAHAGIRVTPPGPLGAPDARHSEEVFQVILDNVGGDADLANGMLDLASVPRPVVPADLIFPVSQTTIDAAHHRASRIDRPLPETPVAR